jgi:predicted transcriptional regulator
MTLATDIQCSEATARALTDQLRQSLSLSWELLVEAYQRRAWAALGYSTWDAYTDAELGQVRLRLPREDRREVVASMTEAGMSVRAIGSALGVTKSQVARDRGVPNGTPDEPIDAEIVDEETDPIADRIARELAASDESYAEQAKSTVGPGQASHQVLGTDGKTYTTTPKHAQRRRPLPESFWQAAYDLTKVTERIERLAEDDRFPQNVEQVATAHRNDLLRAIDVLQDVVNRLTPA